MTQYYILTEDDDEVRALSLGQVPPRIRRMAVTLLEWETEDRLRESALESRQRQAIRARKSKRKRKSAA